MTSADVIWNLLQMYLTEKEKNSKNEEETNDKNDQCKKLHNQLKNSRGGPPCYFLFFDFS